MKNFFTETLKRREKEAGTSGAPEPTTKSETATKPDTGSFFYDTPAELRKKAGKPTK